MPSEIITASLTAFFGVLVLVAGQILQRFILEPILEQRKLVAEVSFVILFYANIDPIITDEERIQEAKITLRTLAGRLRATIWLIPLYSFFSFLRVIPKRNSVLEASRNLIGFSNSLRDGTSKQREYIEKALGFNVND